ncbi:MAG: hypothetical protein DRP06_04455 [Candidatus Aenigmatarchaeota archaeon]|nr:MAG: hypothetical protein DRP06_04455 [Candidatus Aenigmarchaeota archaeon]
MLKNIKKRNQNILYVLIILMAITITLVTLNSNKDSDYPELTTKIEMCDDFNHPETKITCYSFFTSNSTYCDLAGNLKSICWRFATMKNANLELCNKIEDPFQRTICFSNIALKEKNPSICENIKSKTLLESCFLYIPYKYYKLYVEENCDDIGHESAKYTCLAVVKNDSSYCEEITSEPFEKDLCDAIMHEDSSYCGTDACYSQRAIIENNIDLCNSILSKMERARCIGTISKDVETCEKLDDNFANDLCKLYVLASLTLEI